MRLFVDFGRAAAIAMVPVAPSIVVHIIANSVANVCVPTFASDNFLGTFIFFRFVSTIQTFAFGAKFVLLWMGADPTTVTSVPIAPRVVV